MRDLSRALLAGIPLAGLLLTPSPARTQARQDPAQGRVPPRLVIGAPGRCEMVVGGQTRPCTSGLIYVQHANGTVLISVQSGPDITVGFEGGRDRQPRPEDYVLELSRLHSSVSGRTAAKGVRGTCEINMAADGRTWHRATCRATDGNGLLTTVVFTGNGQPVTPVRPGEAGGAADGAAGAAPAPVPDTVPNARPAPVPGAVPGAGPRGPAKN